MSPFDLSEYETVDERLSKFWKDHPMGRVLTELVHTGEDGYIVKASIWRGFDYDPASRWQAWPPGATGYAQEAVTARGVNATSALENCETSAIGRALANLGYAAKGKRPSREEMTKASSSPARSQELASTSGRDGEERGGEGAQGTGEGPAAPEPPQTSTPSGQPEGHHDHEWKPSPNLAGWRYCTVKGCGKAERIPKEVKV